ncbi:MAG: amino acid transporter permease [Rhodospirillales bacterium]|nr:amino acid transporter permease [Rhodospirillales bacterium]
MSVRTTDRTSGVPWYNDEKTRGVLYQVALLALVLFAGWWLVTNTLVNLERRQISTGFSFLWREAGFAIAEQRIHFEPTDSYARALAVGLFNTLEVSAIGIVLATLLGTVVGVARLSSNWLVARFATAYVEVVRNIPLLLQLFFWYAFITQSLPSVREALHPVPGVYLSNRGLAVPVPEFNQGQAIALIGAAIGVVVSILVARWARRRQDATGQPFPTILATLGLVVVFTLVGWLAGGAHSALSIPHKEGFGFTGGAELSPEFAALLIGLTVYTAAFIAEIVRGGVLAVAYGQTEAAMALGLRPAQVMRLILLPQSLRVIVPPMTSQYLNLFKNSTLAIAIGFRDFVSVDDTVMNQTGQAIECIALIMAVYLTVSLLISLFMNWYNTKVALRGSTR